LAAFFLTFPPSPGGVGFLHPPSSRLMSVDAALLHSGHAARQLARTEWRGDLLKNRHRHTAESSSSFILSIRGLPRAGFASSPCGHLTTTRPAGCRENSQIPSRPYHHALLVYTMNAHLHYFRRSFYYTASAASPAAHFTTRVTQSSQTSILWLFQLLRFPRPHSATLLSPSSCSRTPS
jgi:hypothetical protein